MVEVLAKHILSKTQIHLTKVLTEAVDMTKVRVLYDYLGIPPRWKRREREWYRWERLKEGEVLLNTDGSVRDIDFSFGGILRDWNGDPYICYSSKEGTCEVLEKELRAIEIGLRICK